RAARTNQRMVYHYFGGKQGLYDAVRYHVGDELADRLLRALAVRVEEDPVAAYADTLRAYFEAVSGHPTWARMVIHEVLEPSASPSSIARGPEQRFMAAFEPAIRRAQAEGRLRDDLTPMIGLSLAAIVSVMYPLMLREQWLRTATLSDVGVDEPDSAFLDNLVSVILDGVRRGEASRPA